MRRLAFLACALTCGCKHVPIVSDEKTPEVARVPSARVMDAGAVAARDASAPETSPFVVVAHVSTMRLERIAGSGVRAVDVAGNLVWELGDHGTINLIEPFAERVVQSERTPFINIGQLSGRWPLLRVELGFGTGRGESLVHNFVVDVAKGKIDVCASPTDTSRRRPRGSTGPSSAGRSRTRATWGAG